MTDSRITTALTDYSDSKSDSDLWDIIDVIEANHDVPGAQDEIATAYFERLITGEDLVELITALHQAQKEPFHHDPTDPVTFASDIFWEYEKGNLPYRDMFQVLTHWDYIPHPEEITNNSPIMGTTDDILTAWMEEIIDGETVRAIMTHLDRNRLRRQHRDN